MASGDKNMIPLGGVIQSSSRIIISQPQSESPSPGGVKPQSYKVFVLPPSQLNNLGLIAKNDHGRVILSLKANDSSVKQGSSPNSDVPASLQFKKTAGGIQVQSGSSSNTLKSNSKRVQEREVMKRGMREFQMHRQLTKITAESSPGSSSSPACRQFFARRSCSRRLLPQFRKHWKSSLEELGYIKCPLRGCNYICLSFGEMTIHYYQCKGEPFASKFVCEPCNGRLKSEEDLKTHLIQTHSREGVFKRQPKNVDEKPKSDKAQVWIRKRAYSKVHKISWNIALGEKGYVNCFFKNCCFMALTLEQMIQHYGICNGTTAVTSVDCPYCDACAECLEKLEAHINKSHPESSNILQVVNSEANDTAHVSVEEKHKFGASSAKVTSSGKSGQSDGSREMNFVSGKKKIPASEGGSSTSVSKTVQVVQTVMSMPKTSANMEKKPLLHSSDSISEIPNDSADVTTDSEVHCLFSLYEDFEEQHGLERDLLLDTQLSNVSLSVEKGCESTNTVLCKTYSKDNQRLLKDDPYTDRITTSLSALPCSFSDVSLSTDVSDAQVIQPSVTEGVNNVMLIETKPEECVVQKLHEYMSHCDKTDISKDADTSFCEHTLIPQEHPSLTDASVLQNSQNGSMPEDDASLCQKNDHSYQECSTPQYEIFHDTETVYPQEYENVTVDKSTHSDNINLSQNDLDDLQDKQVDEDLFSDPCASISLVSYTEDVEEYIIPDIIEMPVFVTHKSKKLKKSLVLSEKLGENHKAASKVPTKKKKSNEVPEVIAKASNKFQNKESNAHKICESRDEKSLESQFFGNSSSTQCKVSTKSQNEKCIDIQLKKPGESVNAAETAVSNIQPTHPLFADPDDMQNLKVPILALVSEHHEDKLLNTCSNNELFSVQHAPSNVSEHDKDSYQEEHVNTGSLISITKSANPLENESVFNAEGNTANIIIENVDPKTIHNLSPEDINKTRLICEESIEVHENVNLDTSQCMNVMEEDILKNSFEPSEKLSKNEINSCSSLLETESKNSTQSTSEQDRNNLEEMDISASYVSETFKQIGVARDHGDINDSKADGTVIRSFVYLPHQTREHGNSRINVQEQELDEIQHRPSQTLKPLNSSALRSTVQLDSEISFIQNIDNLIVSNTSDPTNLTPFNDPLTKEVASVAESLHSESNLNVMKVISMHSESNLNVMSQVDLNSTSSKSFSLISDTHEVTEETNSKSKKGIENLHNIRTFKKTKGVEQSNSKIPIETEHTEQVSENVDDTQNEIVQPDSNNVTSPITDEKQVAAETIPKESHEDNTYVIASTSPENSGKMSSSGIFGSNLKDSSNNLFTSSVLGVKNNIEGDILISDHNKSGIEINEDFTNFQKSIKVSEYSEFENKKISEKQKEPSRSFQEKEEKEFKNISKHLTSAAISPVSCELRSQKLVSDETRSDSENLVIVVPVSLTSCGNVQNDGSHRLPQSNQLPNEEQFGTRRKDSVQSSSLDININESLDVECHVKSNLTLTILTEKQGDCEFDEKKFLHDNMQGVVNDSLENTDISGTVNITSERDSESREISESQITDSVIHVEEGDKVIVVKSETVPKKEPLESDSSVILEKSVGDIRRSENELPVHASDVSTLLVQENISIMKHSSNDNFSPLNSEILEKKVFSEICVYVSDKGNGGNAIGTEDQFVSPSLQIVKDKCKTDCSSLESHQVPVDTCNLDNGSQITEVGEQVNPQPSSPEKFSYKDHMIFDSPHEVEKVSDMIVPQMDDSKLSCKTRKEVVVSEHVENVELVSADPKQTTFNFDKADNDVTSDATGQGNEEAQITIELPISSETIVAERVSKKLCSDQDIASDTVEFDHMDVLNCQSNIAQSGSQSKLEVHALFLTNKDESEVPKPICSENSRLLIKNQDNEKGMEWAEMKSVDLPVIVSEESKQLPVQAIEVLSGNGKPLENLNIALAGEMEGSSEDVTPHETVKMKTYGSETFCENEKTSVLSEHLEACKAQTPRMTSKNEKKIYSTLDLQQILEGSDESKHKPENEFSVGSVISRNCHLSSNQTEDLLKNCEKNNITLSVIEEPQGNCEISDALDVQISEDKKPKSDVHVNYSYDSKSPKQQTTDIPEEKAKRAPELEIDINTDVISQTVIVNEICSMAGEEGIQSVNLKENCEDYSQMSQDIKKSSEFKSSNNSDIMKENYIPGRGGKREDLASKSEEISEENPKTPEDISTRMSPMKIDVRSDETFSSVIKTDLVQREDHKVDVDPEFENVPKQNSTEDGNLPLTEDKKFLLCTDSEEISEKSLKFHEGVKSGTFKFKIEVNDNATLPCVVESGLPTIQDQKVHQSTDLEENYKQKSGNSEENAKRTFEIKKDITPHIILASMKKNEQISMDGGKMHLFTAKEENSKDNSERSEDIAVREREFKKDANLAVILPSMMENELSSTENPNMLLPNDLGKNSKETSEMSKGLVENTSEIENNGNNVDESLPSMNEGEDLLNSTEDKNVHLPNEIGKTCKDNSEIPVNIVERESEVAIDVSADVTPSSILIGEMSSTEEEKVDLTTELEDDSKENSEKSHKIMRSESKCKMDAKTAVISSSILKSGVSSAEVMSTDVETYSKENSKLCDKIVNSVSEYKTDIIADVISPSMIGTEIPPTECKKLNISINPHENSGQPEEIPLRLLGFDKKVNASVCALPLKENEVTSMENVKVHPTTDIEENARADSEKFEDISKRTSELKLDISVDVTVPSIIESDVFSIENQKLNLAAKFQENDKQNFEMSENINSASGISADIIFPSARESEMSPVGDQEEDLFNKLEDTSKQNSVESEDFANRITTFKTDNRADLDFPSLKKNEKPPSRDQKKAMFAESEKNFKQKSEMCEKIEKSSTEFKTDISSDILLFSMKKSVVCDQDLFLSTASETINEKCFKKESNQKNSEISEKIANKTSEFNVDVSGNVVLSSVEESEQSSKGHETEDKTIESEENLVLHEELSMRTQEIRRTGVFSLTMSESKESSVGDKKLPIFVDTEECSKQSVLLKKELNSKNPDKADNIVESAKNFERDFIYNETSGTVKRSELSSKGDQQRNIFSESDKNSRQSLFFNETKVNILHFSEVRDSPLKKRRHSADSEVKFEEGIDPRVKRRRTSSCSSSDFETSIMSHASKIFAIKDSVMYNDNLVTLDNNLKHKDDLFSNHCHMKKIRDFGLAEELQISSQFASLEKLEKCKNNDEISSNIISIREEDPENQSLAGEYDVSSDSGTKLQAGKRKFDSIDQLQSKGKSIIRDETGICAHLEGGDVILPSESYTDQTSFEPLPKKKRRQLVEFGKEERSCRQSLRNKTNLLNEESSSNSSVGSGYDSMGGKRLRRSNRKSKKTYDSINAHETCDSNKLKHENINNINFSKNEKQIDDISSQIPPFDSEQSVMSGDSALSLNESETSSNLSFELLDDSANSSVVSDDINNDWKEDSQIEVDHVEDMSELEVEDEGQGRGRGRGRGRGSSRGRGRGRGRGSGRGRGRSRGRGRGRGRWRQGESNESKDLLEASEPHDSTENEQPTTTQPPNRDEEIQCGKCSEKMLRGSYERHSISHHNGLGWIEGEPPFDMSNEKLILSVLWKVVKNHKKQLTCEKCGVTKKSAVGFLSHIDFCQTTAEEREALKVKCDICGRFLIPASLKVHQQSHRNDKKPTESIPLVETARTKRAAAAKATSLMQEVIKEESEVEEKKEQGGGEENADLYHRVGPKKPCNPVVAKWKRLILTEGAASCHFPGCCFKSSQVEVLIKHFGTCEKSPKRAYRCELCDFQSKSEKEIKHHLEMEHIAAPDSDPEDIELLKKFPQKGSGWKLYNKLLFLGREITGTIHGDRPYLPAVKWTLQFLKENYCNDDLYPECHTREADWTPLLDTVCEEYLPQTKESVSFSTLAMRGEVADTNCIEFQWKKMKIFESEIIDGVPTVFTGGPIWALAWCTVPLREIETEATEQFLAISCHQQMSDTYRSNEQYVGKGLIQLWNFGPLDNLQRPTNKPKFVLGIAHNYGVVWDLEWCPSGCYETASTTKHYQRLGLLAAACSDGCVHIFSVCHPSCLDSNGRYPIFSCRPVMTLIINDHFSSGLGNLPWSCLRLSWYKGKGHRIIAGGFNNGVVALWNIKTESSLLRKKEENESVFLPYQSFQAHLSCVTALCLAPQDEGRYLMTGSIDTTIKVWDMEDSTGPIPPVVRKGMVTDGIWLTHWLSSITSYDDVYSMGHSNTTLNPPRGYGFKIFPLLPQNSVAWSLSTTDWVNGIAQGTHAGELTAIFPHQLILNVDTEKGMKDKRMILSYIELKDILNKSNEHKCDTSCPLPCSKQQLGNIKIELEKKKSTEMSCNEKVVFQFEEKESEKLGLSFVIERNPRKGKSCIITPLLEESNGPTPVSKHISTSKRKLEGSDSFENLECISKLNQHERRLLHSFKKDLERLNVTSKLKVTFPFYNNEKKQSNSNDTVKEYLMIVGTMKDDADIEEDGIQDDGGKPVKAVERNNTELTMLTDDYEAVKNKFGVVFCDFPADDMTAIPTASRGWMRRSESMRTASIEMYPITSLNKVKWNPNSHSFLWLAAGYQCGLLRVPCISGMHTREVEHILRNSPAPGHFGRFYNKDT